MRTAYQSSYRLRLVLSTVVGLFSILPAQISKAQSEAEAPDHRPYAPLDSSGIDEISFVNGGLHVMVPIVSYPQRGQLQFNLKLQYESPRWFTQLDCDAHEIQPTVYPCLNRWEPVDGTGTFNLVSSVDVTVTLAQGVFSVKVPGNANGFANHFCFYQPGHPASTEDCDTVFEVASSGNGTKPGTEQVPQSYYWIVTSADGATHKMISIGNGRYRSLDGTGWVYDESACLARDRSGIAYQFVCGANPGNTNPTNSPSGGPAPLYSPGVLLHVDDTNGNRIELVNSPPFYGWKDSMGRMIPKNGLVTSTSACPASASAYIANAWQFPGFSEPVVVCYSYYPIRTFFERGDAVPDHVVGDPTNPESNPNNKDYEYNVTGVNLSAIVFPGSKVWQFSYVPEGYDGVHNTGELTKITLPTGGFFKYTWVESDQHCKAELVPVFTSQVSSRTINDGLQDYTWTYSGITGVTDPSGNSTVHMINYLHGCSAYETDTQYKDSAGTVLKTEHVDYQVLPALNRIVTPVMTDEDLAAALPSAVTTTLDDGTVKKIQYSYDSGFTAYDINGATATVPYGNLLTTTESGYGSNGAPGSALKVTTTQYATFSNPAFLSANLLDRVSSTSTGDSLSGETRSETYGYDEYSLSSGNASVEWNDPGTSVRGNQTSTHVAYGNSTLNTTRTYTDTGEVATATDPRSSTTQYSYSADYDGGFLTQVKDALNHTATNSYSLQGGNLLSSTDANGNVTSYAYDGALRLTAVTRPIGSESYEYPDSNTVKKSVQMDSTRSIKSETIFDGLGRVKEVQALGACINGDASRVDSGYDGYSHVISVTNPFCPTDESYGITLSKYDALGRVTIETEQDLNQRKFFYAGSSVTEQDEGAELWTRNYDSLGRLISVKEPTGDNTTYSYNAFGDLKCVDQWAGGPVGIACGSAMNRSFTYDSLSRLITAKNPETGTICYGQWSGSNCTGGYDANDNLLHKTDGSGIEVDYSYDALNRLLTKYSGYENATNYSYTYDQGANGIGRLWQEEDIVGGSQLFSGTQFQYDALGRVISTAWGNIGTNQFSPGMQIQYDLTGNIVQLTYPDNRVVSQSWDSAGRLASVNAGALGSGGSPYVSGIQYYPSGAVHSAAYGSLGYVTQTVSLNSRLQPCRESASTTVLPPATAGGNLMDRELFYASPAESNCMGAVHDNGNIQNILEGVGLTASQAFTYDSLNRLRQASSSNRPAASSYNQTYDIDAFGNMKLVDHGHTPLNYGIEASTNRLTLNGDTTTGDLRYNANGTLAASPNGTGGTFHYIYTGEGNLRGIDDAGGNPYGTGSYLYNAMGERTLAVHNNATWNEYVYLNGQPMASFDSTGMWEDYIYANGQKIARVGSDTRFHLSGTTIQMGGENGAALTPPVSLAVRQGDQISWRQFNHNAVGGINVHFTSGIQTAWGHAANDGQQMNQDYTEDQWLNRTADLSDYAGTTSSPVYIDSIQLLKDVFTPLGDWTIDIGDIAITHADGTVTSIPTVANNSPQGCNAATSYDSVYCFSVPTYSVATDPTSSTDNTQHFTHYFLADQVGTTQMELADGGWPVWEGYFTPFGQEILNGGEQIVPGTVTADGTTNRYKFTGKERDAESGLDYFGARYYGSSMGRWVSPDWSAKEEPVPYAKLDDPQSLNLYEYVRNNPLPNIDPDGHKCDRCIKIWNKIPAPIREGLTFVACQEGCMSTEGSGEILAKYVKKVEQLQTNKENGKAFEKVAKIEAESKQTGVVEQLTVRTKSGVKTRLDLAGKDKLTGLPALNEAKASATASLTTNQSNAFPEIEQSGATVVGQGKPGFPGGTEIPPTKVEIIRPPVPPIE